MEHPRSRFTPVPSHAVLVLGGLGFVWLVLAGLLVLGLDADARDAASAPAPVAETTPPRLATGGVPSAAVSLPSPEPEPPGPTPEGLALDEAPAPEAALADEAARPALRSAHDEPILLELTTLLEAIHPDLDGPGTTLDPALTAYAGALARRMNTQGETFVASLSAPDPQAARRRAARFHALLVEAGLRPWLLEVFGERGADGASVERG